MTQNRAKDITLHFLLKPYVSRIHHDWAFWSSVGSVFIFAVITRALPYADRAHIARDTIGVTVPLVIGLLAISIASFTIFATLSTPQFIKILGGSFNYLVSLFFITIAMTIFTALLLISIYIASYSEFVNTNLFFWLCQMALGALTFCFLQVLDNGRIVSLQVISRALSDAS